MVSSRVYPGLERKPGGPDNWVERAGGLPSYIERIAKHLHYEQGKSISHSIAAAVNTVKRWARGGTVTKYGTTKRISPKTQALAAKAVAEWEAKKKAGRLNLSEAEFAIIDLSEASDGFAWDLVDALDLSEFDAVFYEKRSTPQIVRKGAKARPKKGYGRMIRRRNATKDEAKVARKGGWVRVDSKGRKPSDPGYKKTAYRPHLVDNSDTGTGVDPTEHATLSAMNIEALAARANAIADPKARAEARAVVLNLAFGYEAVEGTTIDLASTIPPRNAKGKASDGRNSFAGQGKFKHGFIPVNQAAKEAKAKGSPIAMKRMKRLFGANKAPDDPRRSTREVPKSPSPIPSKVAKAKYERSETLQKSATKVAKDARDKQQRNVRNFEKAAVGRAGTRHALGRKKDPHSVNIDEKTQPGSEKAQDVGFLRNTDIQESKNVVKNTGNQSQKEASKKSRIPERARQNWDEIPETLKTVRNGKRFVVAEFGGKQYVTEWVGGVRETASSALSKRKVMSSLTSADAANMSVQELRDLVNNPRSPASVRKVARAAARAKGSKS